MVGHASTLDLAIGMFNRTPRTILPHEFIRIADHYPYCSSVPIVKQNDGTLKYDLNFISPITYTGFTSKINKEFAIRLRSNAEI